MELLVNIASNAHVSPDLLSSNGPEMNIRSKIFRLCIDMPMWGAYVEEKVRNRIGSIASFFEPYYFLGR